MAVAAETLHQETQELDFLLWEDEVEPLVHEVPNLESDELIRRRAERFIGDVVTSASFEKPEQASATGTTSLMDALRRAQAGETEARKLVEMNVRTDVIERTIKAGHVMKVQLAVNEQGQVVQYGQTAESIQANSLKFAAESPQMRERTEAETRNMFRIDSLLREGLLDDYAFVVFSRAADNMTEEEMHDVGFFTDTMSCAIQVTTLEDGQLTTESAFVAGKKSSSSERHDDATIVKLGAQLDADFVGKSATEVLDTPLLIHKSLLPYGAIDLVRLYDEAANETFFGEDKPRPRQDYLAYREMCRTRELELEPTVQEIAAGLIAFAGDLDTPVSATRKLHELSQSSLVERAVTDLQINPLVFGPESAKHVEDARYWSEQGDLDRVNAALDRAQATADSSSCPGGGKDMAHILANQAEESATTSEDGDCDFMSAECPMCRAKNVRTTVKTIGAGKKRISGACGCSKEFKAK